MPPLIQSLTTQILGPSWLLRVIEKSPSAFLKIYMFHLILNFFPFYRRISSSNMKIGRLIFYPFDKFSYIVIFQDTFNCMVIIKQLPLGKSRVYLSVTNSMKEHNVSSFKCVWDQMMLAWFFRKSTFA